ncbi:hypothetical protein DL96DRAFT_1719666 [Flagelloscypha sp. PMI_526]|nr:hypothetical protein DL96DRAFT_1719666 [Flagelloscypha sp. PMI_526]
MVPQLPHELWSKIYNHFVNTATKRSELVCCMLVHSLAHNIIFPRLFETFISNASFKSPSELFFKLPQATQKSCIKRFYIDHRQDLRPYLFDLSRVLEQARDSIERLYFVAPPESGLDPLVASLKNLTFLQISLLQFAALQREADVDPLLWAGTLEKLYLDIGDKALYLNDERLRLRKLSKAMKGLDLNVFPRLTHVVFTGRHILDTIKEILPRLLSKFVSIQLFIVFDLTYMNGYRTPEQKRLISSMLLKNDRVIYYQSTSGRRILELAFDKFCERTAELLWRRRDPFDGPAADAPFDDWGEITACKQLHVWEWAESAHRDGNKIFGLDLQRGEGHLYGSWPLQ